MLMISDRIGDVVPRVAAVIACESCAGTDLPFLAKAYHNSPL